MVVIIILFVKICSNSDSMPEIKKKRWAKARIIFPAIYGKIKEQGNSARFFPSIPAEYVGKKAVLVILEEDKELDGGGDE
ncbi:Protein of unknown function DUF2080, transposon-encoded [Methanotorris igneus Kol 5]|uniref:Transposon-encoded protein n=2 Tax=Methanotorris igneus TaxID=2189 RepID=F6BBZ5_METIK|nr:Protein of unknown function DUF2080, transposon-encoded [Methanotorris igneus Kol 5]